MTTSLLVDYPIFSLGINNDFIAISGGGGGKEYGIVDKLDVYKRDPDNKFTFLYSWNEAPGILECLKYSESNNLWIGYSNTKCYVLRITIVKVIECTVIDSTDNLSCCKFCKDKLIITGSVKGLVCVYNLMEDGNKAVKLCKFNGHSAEIKDVLFVHNKCISSCNKGELRLWDTCTGELLHKKDDICYEDKKTICRFLNFYDADDFGEIFISLNCNNKGPTIIFIWHIYKIGKQFIMSILKFFVIGSCPCSAISYSNKYGLALGFGSGNIAIVCNKSWKVKKNRQIHQLPVTGIDFIDENNVVSGGVDFLLSITNMKVLIPLWLGILLASLFIYIIFKSSNFFLLANLY